MLASWCDPPMTTLMRTVGADPLGTNVSGISRSDSDNIAALVLRHAESTPNRVALIDSGKRSNSRVTYRALADRVAMYAGELESRGIGAGDRVLVLLPMSVDLYAIALAVLGIGATLTLVDGRFGRRRLLAAIADAKAHAIVAPPRIMRWWPLIPALWQMRRLAIDARASARHPAANASCVVASVRPDHAAIVSFTSGTTGRAKAIVRTHAVLVAQHRALAATFPTSENDVNLPGFPVAALHNLCCGTTTVLPPATRLNDASRGGVIADVIRRHGITSLSASPALLDDLARSVLCSRRPLSSLSRIVVGGGPVSRALSSRVLRAFPNADARILYGATEAEPIATVSMSEAIVARGTGFLVGYAAGDVDLALSTRDGNIATSRREADGPGEVIVRGSHVIRGASSAPGGWHRTGDVGAFDERGRLWLLGRVGSSVMHGGREVFPYAVEAEVLSVSGVRAAALVAHGRAPDGVLAVSFEPGANASEVVGAIRARLIAMRLDTLNICLCGEIPMDARHASKVARDELARRLARGRE